MESASLYCEEDAERPCPTNRECCSRKGQRHRRMNPGGGQIQPAWQLRQAGANIRHHGELLYTIRYLLVRVRPTGLAMAFPVMGSASSRFSRCDALRTKKLLFPRNENPQRAPAPDSP